MAQQAFHRQRLAAQEELVPDNNPVLACKEKAIYLLKFGGLTRVQLKQEVRREEGFGRAAVVRSGPSPVVGYH